MNFCVWFWRYISLQPKGWMAQWLSWLERRPVTAEVTGSSPVWVVSFERMKWIWGLSSAGRASALQAEGHRFEPYRPHIYGGVAQLARAHGSYPWCQGFKSLLRYWRTSEIDFISFWGSFCMSAYNYCHDSQILFMDKAWFAGFSTFSKSVKGSEMASLE